MRGPDRNCPSCDDEKPDFGSLLYHEYSRFVSGYRLAILKSDNRNYGRILYDTNYVLIQLGLA